MTNLAQGTSYDFVLRAICSGQSPAVSPVAQVTGTLGSVQGPYQGIVGAIPGTIESEDYDTGGQGIAYNDTNATNSGGQYRPNEGVDVATAAGGGYQIGWTSSGEWQEYTVNVASAGDYNVDIVYAGNAGNPGAVRIEFDGVDKTNTVALPVTGGWNTFQTVTATANLSAGQQIMRVFTVTGGINLNSVTFSETVTADCSAAPAGLTVSALSYAHSQQVLLMVILISLVQVMQQEQLVVLL